MARNGTTVHFIEVFDHIHETYTEVKQPEFQIAFFQAMEPLIGTQSGGYRERIENHDPHTLSLEAYFQLLEYEELKEARQASINALSMTTFALAVASALALVSISFQAGWL